VAECEEKFSERESLERLQEGEQADELSLGHGHWRHLLEDAAVDASAVATVIHGTTLFTKR
jgi:hypothetical protein